MTAPLDARTPLRPTVLRRPALRLQFTGWLQRQWHLARRPRLENGWASLCGAGHARNQDAVLAAPPLYAVADGVGGGRAGELASSQMLAWCRSIPSTAWQDAKSLAEWMRQADDALANSLQSLNPGGLSATTFAGAWLAHSGRGHVVHIGDTRVLRLSPERKAWRVHQVTMDQTYANTGEAPPPGGSPDDPARMVGVGAIGNPPVARLKLGEGEILMICSDGLHRFVLPRTIAELCKQASDLGHPISKLADQLALAAQAAGSQDDISVLLVRKNALGGARQAYWAVAALAAAVTLILLIASPTPPAAHSGAAALLHSAPASANEPVPPAITPELQASGVPR